MIDLSTGAFVLTTSLLIRAEMRGSCEQVDSVQAGFAGYYVHAAEQPAHEVPQSLREHQFQSARAILARLGARLTV